MHIPQLAFAHNPPASHQPIVLNARRLHTDKKEALFAPRTRLLSSPNKAWLGGKEGEIFLLGVKESEVKKLSHYLYWFRINDRRSSVPRDNTIQAIHNWQTCSVLSSGTLDLLSFYSFTFLLLNIAVR